MSAAATQADAVRGYAWAFAAAAVAYLGIALAAVALARVGGARACEVPRRPARELSAPT